MACSSAMTAHKVRKQENLRFRGIEDEYVAKYAPQSKLFRIAVLDFVDQTHNTAGKVEDMFADVMTTSLYRTSRFTLYDRSQLKRKNRAEGAIETVAQSKENSTSDPSKSKETTTTQMAREGARFEDSEQVERQMRELSKDVDGIFDGFITNAEMAEGGTRGHYTIDYRIVKRLEPAPGQVSTIVIFADSATVSFTGNPLQASGRNADKDTKPITLNRPDLEAIATKVADFFPRLKAPEYASARVTDVNGRTVTISLGNKYVKPGYSFFVITEPDEATGEFDYKGNFVVRDAFDKASRADLTLVDDRFMKSIKVGDRILMK